MITYFLSFVSGLLTLLVIDAVMIYFVILPTFKRYIPTYLNTDMNIPAAVLFYIFYILVLLFLVIIPGVEGKGVVTDIVMRSALFGFGAYMTYELTSMSVIKGWNWNMVLLDVTWGTILTAIIGFVMFQVYKYFM
ncbi:DUF2177 family protein [Candidatus Gracilibacteria bacterium]|nr:DUF2177 family protein [Candidatus Gracilibacteria bacterium]